MILFVRWISMGLALFFVFCQNRHLFLVFLYFIKMRRWIIGLSSLLALSSPVASVEADTCQFYLAESSIPNAGFGIYTVKSIEKGQFIQPSSDAPSIVITDVDKHNLGHDPNWNHVNYVWAGEGWADFESNAVWESVPTFGALSNFHTYLYNIKPIAAPYNDAMTPRSSESPGMGAYSYYGGKKNNYRLQC
jgi:hypothetical protein